MADTSKHSGEATKDTSIRHQDEPALHGIAENLHTLQQDLEVARKIQGRLLPPRPEIPGYDFDLFCQSAGEVGGDFYDFLPMGPDRTGILVADASGKGLAGALLMVEARAMIRVMASMTISPREILAAVNRVLLRDFEKGRFVSAYFVLLDTKARTLTLANAGHTPLLLCRERDQTLLQFQPKGPILGVLPDERFRQGLTEETVELQPGDRFLLYTDGVSELMNPVGEEFGMDRLVSWMRLNAHRSSDDVIRSLVDVLESHRAGQQQSDDITIVTGRLGPYS